MITMSVNLIGASAVNFTTDEGSKFDYIKLNVLLENKSGFGSVSQSFKYEVSHTELEKQFGFVEAGKTYPCILEGEFKSNGKSAEFVANKVTFQNQQTK
ncbi:hypothetical protein [Moraxella catarrhalis]|uniref:hypothetical protein n=1 Tax=Moraxella catarrhalis TaxID=480 RepID=UPI000202AB7D|nr:hypothetical protein [Moraxella catarrhalis]EGE22680.1 hypothetical protein E9U_00015 [Moraxella catarrhalis BC8]RKL73122.1 hypothetical protein D6D91_09330 [Moraxella catarrhalis]RKL73264.1 hypothetical protein D6D66_08715 [Moraxella catarrhalis]RKM35794.1 hypothetical protein D6D62_02840 [Moraxella catarrhalis]